MEGVGIAGQLGLKVLTSWATAWATADVFKSFLSESLTANYDRIDDDSLEAAPLWRYTRRSLKAYPGIQWLIQVDL